MSQRHQKRGLTHKQLLEGIVPRARDGRSQPEGQGRARSPQRNDAQNGDANTFYRGNPQAQGEHSHYDRGMDHRDNFSNRGATARSISQPPPDSRNRIGANFFNSQPNPSRNSAQRDRDRESRLPNIDSDADLRNDDAPNRDHQFHLQVEPTIPAPSVGRRRSGSSNSSNSNKGGSNRLKAESNSEYPDGSQSTSQSNNGRGEYLSPIVDVHLNLIDDLEMDRRDEENMDYNKPQTLSVPSTGRRRSGGSSNSMKSGNKDRLNAAPDLNAEYNEDMRSSAVSKSASGKSYNNAKIYNTDQLHTEVNAEYNDEVKSTSGSKSAYGKQPSSVRSYTIDEMKIDLNAQDNVEDVTPGAKSAYGKSNIFKSRTEYVKHEDRNNDAEMCEVPRAPSRRRSRSGGNNGASSNTVDRLKVDVDEYTEDFKCRRDSNYGRDDNFSIYPPDFEKRDDYTCAGEDGRYNPKCSKKVSYSMDSNEAMCTLPYLSDRRGTPSPVSCRLRTECVETDESDMSFTASSLPGRKGSRQYGNDNQNTTDRCKMAESQQNLAMAMDEYFGNRMNNNNNNVRILSVPSNASLRSQDSLQGQGVKRVASNLYKDIAPLPIEIPDNVEDAEAFRRYLSVRRGAVASIRLNNSFEKRNQQSSSYDSLGRKPGRGSLGLTPSNQLGQEASKRTASLSHAIMTLALLSASICQLRFLITYSHAHSYPILNYFLVFTSIILEVAAGIGYVMIARCSYDDAQTEAIHNYLIFALFIVAVSNVVLAAFAFDDHICEGKKLNDHTTPNPQQDQQIINQPMMPRPDRVMDLRYMPLE